MTRRSHFLFCCGAQALVLILAGARPCFAAGAGKIGFVDIDRVRQKAKFVRGMLQDIESTLAAKHKALQAKEDEYVRLKRDIDRKSPVMGEGDLDALRKRARDLFVQIDDETDQINKMLGKAEKERMAPAVDRILETVKKVGEEEGFDLIVRGEAILYGAAAADITDKVIERLDRENAAAPSANPAAGDGGQEAAEAGGEGADSKEGQALQTDKENPTPTPTPEPSVRSSGRGTKQGSSLRTRRSSRARKR